MKHLCLPVLTMAGALSVAAAGQSGDVSGSLDEAKALYRDARFAEAVARIHDVIVAVTPQAHVPEGQALLVDAHMHMALCHVALNSPTAARESFKDMLRLDRSRRLDPAVYAPKVVELFAEARRELDAGEPVTSESSTDLGKGEQGSGSRTLPILLGVAAAAGVAVAVGGGGGDSSGTGTSTGTTSTPAPPTPTSIELPGDEVIMIAGMNPPLGSRFSLSSTPTASIDLLITFSQGRFAVDAGIDDNVPSETPSSCGSFSHSDFFDAGEGVGVTVTIDLTLLNSGCDLPDDFRWEINVNEFAGDRVATLSTNAVYTIDP